MNPDHWESAKRLFHEALERSPTDRDRFVREATAGDGELRDEVLALLSAQTRADHPFGDVARSAGTQVLRPGTRLGPYEIHHLIGVGGMGEVYHARDPKLRRDVAIKILPRSMAHDGERLRRFEREAQLLASLNQPNIAAIYGFEEANGLAALVLELVEGPTLADRIARGPVSVDEALAIGRQIADALDAAHERGIVHRDLKPANIKLTPEGTIKVLDFGLAKAMASEAGGLDLTHSPTITAIGTREGLIAGTAPYMSPEQARGKSVDKRADIWAFGCVVYELLTGTRAFPGDTTTDVLAAVVNREPDWRALPAKTPASIRRLLGRCLEKDPKRRLRDIGDARVEIDDASVTVDRPPVVGRRSARDVAVWVLVFLTAVAAAAAIAFVAGRLSLRPPPTLDVRVHRLTDWAGLEEMPAISPDGRSVAFVASTGTSRQIWVRLLAGGAPLQLTRDSGDHLFPRWSPDSSSVLYFSEGAESAESGALWEVSALGGAPRGIVSGIGAADISHDGTKLAFFRFQDGRVELAITARDGSDARPIAQLESGFYYLSPRWSPDDRSIAYTRMLTNVADMYVVPAAGGTPRQVTQDATVQEGLTWSSDGSRLIFSSARGATIRYLPTANLWSVRADGRELRQLTFGETTYTSPDVSQSGSLIASRWRLQSDIWRIPVDHTPIENAARATRVTKQTSQVYAPTRAPDGSQVAFVSDGGGHANIWVHTLATGEARQITYEQESDVQVGLPLWSPAGDQIAYFTARRESLNYWVVNPDGSNRRLLAPDAGWATWSPDGKWLYFGGVPRNRYLVKVASAGGTALTVRPETATRPALSPDGLTLYYMIELPVWTGGLDIEVRAASPENGPGRLLARIPNRRLQGGHSFQPVISPDGQWLLLALVDDQTTNLWALSTTTGALRQLTDFQGRPTIIIRRADWAPDGRSVFAALGERDADIVLLEGLRDR